MKKRFAGSFLKVSALGTVRFQFCNCSKAISSTDGARVIAHAQSWCGHCFRCRTERCPWRWWGGRSIRTTFHCSILSQRKQGLGLWSHSLETLCEGGGGKVTEIQQNLATPYKRTDRQPTHHECSCQQRDEVHVNFWIRTITIKMDHCHLHY